MTPLVDPAVTTALAGAGALWGATVLRVYRGGSTLNDHFVVAVVTGCLAVYPLLWLGALDAGIAGVARAGLGLALAVAAACIYGLFHVLDLRRDPGLLVWWARLSQPAYAFSLWSGLLLVGWVPFAALTQRPILWPGRWLVAPLALALWGTVWTWWRRWTVNRHRLAGPGPLRIVQLSDLHASPVTPARDLQPLVDRVNALEPDLVVVTGDLVMPFSEERHDYLLAALALLRAPAFACPGNHDVPVSVRLGEELRALGIAWLVDRAVTVELRGLRVEVAGVDFHWRDARRHLEAALAGLPRPTADLHLLLAHDPRLFRWLPDGRFDLVFSGHTHGGQVGLDMFGWSASVFRPLGVFDQGWFQRGATRLYVHKGNWSTGLPPRMGIAGEIAVFELDYAMP